MTPAAIIHRLAGAPSFDGCADLPAGERCWLCAAPAGRGMLASEWSGANFTDQDKARSPSSLHVCEPCCWATSWVAPPGYVQSDEAAAKKAAKRAERIAAGEKVGKERTVNIRLFSHLYDEGGYLALNKEQKPQILRWLREPKQGQWFAAIADSGQKHVLPWTPLNPAGCGVVRFEERNIALPRGDDWKLVDDIAELLTHGVTKEEISTGRYSMLSAQHCRWQLHAFEHGLGGQRASAWFDLALWLAQRNEEESDAIKADRAAKRSAEAKARSGAARGARRVPSRRSEPAQALGPDQGPAASSRAAERDGGTDADVAVPSPASTGPEQFSLFEDPRAGR